MRIALLTQYYKPEMGAPQNRLLEMVMGLKRHGNDVCVVTSMPNYPTGKIFEQYNGKTSMVENMDGIEIKRYWLYASNTKKIFPRIWNMVSFSFMALFSTKFLKMHKIDCIIVESPPLTLGLTGWWLSKRTKSKFIFNVSDLWPLSAKELGVIGEGRVYRFLEKIESFLYRKATFCMGQSEEIVRYMENRGATKTYLFRNGVDPSRFAKMECREPQISHDKFVVVYAGLLGFAQGIADICQNINFAELGAEFHIYGAGGEQGQIESFIKKNPKNGIFFHGSVKREDIPVVLSQADATLIPLVKHIFGAVPSKIYESMAAGLPILFSGEGEGQKIIEENDLGWVSKAMDYEAMKNNIRYMIKHPEDVERKRKNCIDCAKNKFNRVKQIEGLNDFISSLII